MSKIAIVQIRGIIGTSQKVRKTLRHLGLVKKNSCVVIETSSSLKGMLVVVADYVTWGEINEAAFYELMLKRGKVAGNKPLTDEYVKKNINTDIKGFSKDVYEGKNKIKDLAGIKPYFRLTPPVGGFGKGIKKAYSLGGALGYRKDNINDLIKRML